MPVADVDCRMQQVGYITGMRLYGKHSKVILAASQVYQALAKWLRVKGKKKETIVLSGRQLWTVVIVHSCRARIVMHVARGSKMKGEEGEWCVLFLAV